MRGVVLDQLKKNDLRVMPWWLIGLGLIAAVILGWIVIVWHTYTPAFRHNH